MNKLDKLKAEISAKKNSNMIAFDDVTVVYLGVEPKPYYAKMKDSQGNTLKDDKGNDRRQVVSSGMTYTFSEVGTSNIVKVVSDKRYALELLSVYKVSGLGYDLRKSSMIFIQNNGIVKAYE